jgi:hypothetical protein
MEYYAIGLGITVITIIISLSIFACCCKCNICADPKDERGPLIDNYKEIIISI